MTNSRKRIKDNGQRNTDNEDLDFNKFNMITHPSNGGSWRLSRTDGNSCCEDTAVLVAVIEVSACGTVHTDQLIELTSKLTNLIRTSTWLTIRFGGGFGKLFGGVRPLQLVG